MYCSACGDEREFEQPPCPDGHGADCPERACTACGTAVLVDPPMPGAGPGRPAPPRTPASSPSASASTLSGSGPSGSVRAASQRAVA
ncbi:hypothetical protein [Actinomadura rugatobispora]|uniref:Uncharacterized protein n=1 Tax=Actinomadura rugatobispora TaxID=1994 RepID=A0ABW1A2T3_9ACTN